MTDVIIGGFFVALTVLVLAVGYSYGRWETEAHYEPIIDELEDTIDALLPSGIKVRS